ncbi:unnamed protein product, partial [Choristocarpus tenellus]
SVKNRAQRVWNGFKGVFRTKKRLHFLCPYDGTVIPWGLDGNGYPFHGTREWVKKLYPVVQGIPVKRAAVVSDSLEDIADEVSVPTLTLTLSLTLRGDIVRIVSNCFRYLQWKSCV